MAGKKARKASEGQTEADGRPLVVVESPTKARTIARILGGRYQVKASLGHIRDLPPDELGVDIQKGFLPKYIVLKEKRPVLQEIRKSAEKAPAVYLATDPDREGEAIAWHLVEAVRLKDRPVHRVTFHEITPEAVRKAFQEPRGIDQRLVEAQQARRVLDRLVGYRLSPLLWDKLRWRGLSAGRVQSAALRMVVEREREIESFVPREYWVLWARLARPGDRPEGAFRARLVGWEGEKGRLEVPDGITAERLRTALEGADYRVARVVRKEVRQRPAPPFITSTLQQEAWRKLRFPARKTMQVAQQLYEGVPLGDEGQVGLITYMRTDSPHIAESAQREARDYIRTAYGEDFLPPRPRQYTARSRTAQEAHEAIRPTSVHRTPERVRPYLTPDQYRLYELIWRRFLASQMADAVLDQTTVEVSARPSSGGPAYLLQARGSVLKFPGFRAVYLEDRDEPEEEDEERAPLPPLQEGQPLHCLGVEAQQRFTQPPPRYTEASLIRAMEERGIGRPSTYAAIVSNIQERGYVRREGGRLVPTPLGRAVNDLLTRHFPDVVDLDFTARMEEDLDRIARGEEDWRKVLEDFYRTFSRELEQAQEAVDRVEVQVGETCELCGRPMVLKQGRFGPFLSCSGFPECRNRRPLLQRTGALCPQCGGDLVERRARKGKRRSTFYGCSNYPTCNFAVSQRPLLQPCPECGGLLLQAGRNRARCHACGWNGPVPSGEPVPAPEP